MLEEIIKKSLKKVISEVYEVNDLDFEVTKPTNPNYGDYSTNVALILANELKQSSFEIAKTINYKLFDIFNSDCTNSIDTKYFRDINVAQPGFINFFIDPKWTNYLLRSSKLIDYHYREEEFLKKNLCIFEYTDPNPFKVFHIGHLMTNIIGESLARIFEFAGNEVKRVNYQGDVGMHVAKAIWGIIRLLDEGDITFDTVAGWEMKKRIEFMGKGYTLGANQFEDSEKAREEIGVCNLYVYTAAQKLLIENTGMAPIINFRSLIDTYDEAYANKVYDIYKTGREWSLDFFESLYKVLGTSFDGYYFESEISEQAVNVVRENLSVFKVDNGAIIFEGEKYGLHTRVFINSKGLPVYESKDLALAIAKYKDYKYDYSYIVTGNEVNTYFQVVLKALEQIRPDLSEKTIHIGHGMMKLASGKMSSRKGNVVGGMDLIYEVRGVVVDKMRANKTVAEVDMDRVGEKIALASVKFLILKSGIGNDVIYAPGKISDFEGDTGAYVLYTYARICSILRQKSVNNEFDVAEFTASEADLIRTLMSFNQAFGSAYEHRAPNALAGYALDLCHKFNKFYAEEKVLDSEKEVFRLRLCELTSITLKRTLDLLGIDVVDRM